MNSQRGFTLLEVIIAMMILMFMAIFTGQAINRGLQTKAKVQKDIDKTSTLRDALRVMERDINMAFNWRDINVQLYNLAQEERKKKATAGSGTPPTGTPPTTPPATPPPAPPTGTPPKDYPLKKEVIFTHFIGEPKSLAFTSLSNIRMMEDAPISSQAEIGYVVKGCRRRSSQETSTQCLWRRISNYIHEDITRHGEETVLLENVAEFSLRYLGPGRDGEWVDTWITNERGDDTTKNKFPYAVEITLAVKDDRPEARDKVLRMTTVAAIRNPNNPKDEKAPDGTNPATQ